MGVSFSGTGQSPSRPADRSPAGERSSDPCPVCQSSEASLVALKDRYGKPLTTLACRQCGLMRMDPLPSAEQLSQFHESQYRQQYKGTRRPTLRRVFRSGRLAQKRLDSLRARLRAGSKVLDIGSGSGEWLYTLQSLGHKPVGIEPDPVYGNFAREEYGVEVRTGSIYSLDLAGQKFDCITLFHVLEHLPDPIAALSKLRECLKPGGLVVIEVPNVRSRHQHPAKRFHYAHVVGFTPESLSHVARRLGASEFEMSLDRYERNIFAVLSFREEARRLPDPAVPPPPLVCSPAATAQYYLRPSTYVRAMVKLLDNAREAWASKSRKRPRQLLDSLV